MRQQLHDEQQELVAIVRHSYSEAAAYVLLLIRVDWHLDDLASLLWIGVDALRQRLKASGLRARVQPSLFDGREVIDPEFTPWRQGRSIRRSGQSGETPQLAFLL